jgi:exodeoxyribonuclease-3
MPNTYLTIQNLNFLKRIVSNILSVLSLRYKLANSMKIATYNVNGVNGRLPVLLRWLEETNPDVVCLQELKAPQEKFPEQAIIDAGYNAVWHGQKRWNGVAILAKADLEIKEVGRNLPGDPEDVQSRYIGK